MRPVHNFDDKPQEEMVEGGAEKSYDDGHVAGIMSKADKARTKKILLKLDLQYVLKSLT
jgi:hypothetical protein